MNKNLELESNFELYAAKNLIGKLLNSLEGGKKKIQITVDLGESQLIGFAKDEAGINKALNSFFEYNEKFKKAMTEYSLEDVESTIFKFKETFKSHSSKEKVVIYALVI